ncbi:MAG: hypothetical protein AAGJ29_05535 [Pseudomonadota bacterium]
MSAQSFAISIFLAVTVIFSGGSALAQDDAVKSAAERAAACLEIEDSAERLTCLESAAEVARSVLRGDLAKPTGEPDIVSEPRLRAPEPAPVKEAEAPTAAAPAETAALPPAQPAPEAPTPAPETPPAPEDSRIRPEPPEAEPRPGVLARLRPERPQDVALVIERITKRRRDGRHTFYTSAGEVLQQSDLRQNFRAPNSLPANARVEFGVLGSKWLVFEDNPKNRFKVTLVD